MEPRALDFSGQLIPNLERIPSGVKWLTAARTIRWFGWGFGETLLPVFILSFSASLTEAGILSSAYDFLFLISLPVVGFFADVVSSRILLIIGLLIYPFIGLSLYLAGVFGTVLFLILARALNGIAYCLDTVGTDTYIRRVTPGSSIASAFGFMASWANFGWALAAIAGAYVVRFVPIHVLLFAVTPFALVALIPLIHAKRDVPAHRRSFDAQTLLHPLSAFLKEVATMKKGFRSVVFLMFILDVASIAATFFIPIDAYRNGASLSAVAFLCVLSALPTLSEFWLAEFIDGSSSKRRWSLFFALAALPFLFLVSSFVTAFSVRILVAFGIELAAILGSLSLQSYATVLSHRDRFGEISSVLEGASTVGDLTGPLAIGLLADALGFPYTFAILAGGFLLIAVYFYRHPIER